MKMNEATPEARRELMERFISRYWPPVYAYLRRKRHRPEEAAEITQAFFSDVVMTRDLAGKADPERGRLRSYLLTALDRYLIDRSRRDGARGVAIPIDQGALEREEDRLLRAEPTDESHEFDRRWAFGMLDEAMRRCERHYRNGDKAGHWTLFEARVLQPAITGNRPPSLKDVCEAHGFRSVAHATSGIYQVRQRIRTLLREVVSETVINPREVDAELQELPRLISPEASGEREEEPAATDGRRRIRRSPDDGLLADRGEGSVD